MQLHISSVLLTCTCPWFSSGGLTSAFLWCTQVMATTPCARFLIWWPWSEKQHSMCTVQWAALHIYKIWISDLQCKGHRLFCKMSPTNKWCYMTELPAISDATRHHCWSEQCWLARSQAKPLLLGEKAAHPFSAVSRNEVAEICDAHYFA